MMSHFFSPSKTNKIENDEKQEKSEEELCLSLGRYCEKEAQKNSESPFSYHLGTNEAEWSSLAIVFFAYLVELSNGEQGYPDLVNHFLRKDKEQTKWSLNSRLVNCALAGKECCKSDPGYESILQEVKTKHPNQFNRLSKQTSEKIRAEVKSELDDIIKSLSPSGKGDRKKAVGSCLNMLAKCSEVSEDVKALQQILIRRETLENVSVGLRSMVS